MDLLDPVAERPPWLGNARVLIVEDLEQPRKWLAGLLRTALPEVGPVDCAATLAEAYRCIADHAYGLAVIDWTLPDGDSEELIRTLVANLPQVTVIVATIHHDDDHVFQALRAGASGYLLKSESAEVLTAQLQRLRLREPALSPSVARRVLRYFQSAHQPDSAPQEARAPRVELTERERDVLRLIGKGYRVLEVSELLGISAHTVSSYVRDIYRKLGISSRAEAATEAIRRGLVG